MYVFKSKQKKPWKILMLWQSAKDHVFIAYLIIFYLLWGKSRHHLKKGKLRVVSRWINGYFKSPLRKARFLVLCYFGRNILHKSVRLGWHIMKITKRCQRIGNLRDGIINLSFCQEKDKRLKKEVFLKNKNHLSTLLFSELQKCSVVMQTHWWRSVRLIKIQLNS